MAIGPSPPQGKQQKFRPSLMVFLAQKQSHFPFFSEPNLHYFRFKIVIFRRFFPKTSITPVYPPTEDASHKWRFRLGFPILKIECHDGGEILSWVGGSSKISPEKWWLVQMKCPFKETWSFFGGHERYFYPKNHWTPPSPHDYRVNPFPIGSNRTHLDPIGHTWIQSDTPGSLVNVGKYTIHGSYKVGPY